MLRRLLRRGLRPGDDVTVLVGPFEGHTGRITELNADGRFLVVIDECCMPLVAESDLRLVKSTSFAEQLANIHHRAERNPEGDIARAQGSGGNRPGIVFGVPPTTNIDPPSF